MRPALVCLLLVAAIACVAQQSGPVACSVALNGTATRLDDNLSVKQLRIKTGEATYSANVFRPVGNVGPLPALMFAHATIVEYERSVDLIPFAKAVARAGSITVLVNRDLKWLPFQPTREADTAVYQCVYDWLVKNERLDGRHIGWAGPGPTVLQQSGPSTPNHHPTFVLNYGSLGPAETANTESMMTVAGQLKMIRFLRLGDIMGISEISPEWLEPTNHPSAE